MAGKYRKPDAARIPANRKLAVARLRRLPRDRQILCTEFTARASLPPPAGLGPLCLDPECRPVSLEFTGGGVVDPARTPLDPRAFSAAGNDKATDSAVLTFWLYGRHCHFGNLRDRRSGQIITS